MRDTFLGGVEPGGLTDRFEVKILVCYLLDQVNLPLSAQMISDILLNRGLVNYFELSAALSELLQNGYMVPIRLEGKPQQYNLSAKGKQMLETLGQNIPLSVREKAVDSATELLLRKRREEQNKVTIAQVEDGYTITLKMLDIGSDLMSLKLFVPDKEQAEQIKERFFEDPARVYKGILELLTDAFSPQEN